MIASSSSSTVAPSDSPSEPSPSSSEQEKKQSNDWYANIRQVCLSLQISHGGRYSIERLLALEEYTRNTSFVRALMVCVGTPLPMAALVLLQECVPLQDPTEGWSANFGFWIRVGTLGGVVAIGMAVFAIVMIPGVVLSRLQLVLIFMGQAIGYSVTAMFIAALWAFPIPFMIWTVMGFYMLLFIALFRMIMGKEGFQQMAARRDELMLLVSYSGSQSVMAIAYAVYTVLFEHVANTRFELPVIFLLPVIKVTMKNLVSLFIVHMEDMIPEGVIFTVDFFNSMYLTMCMQNTSSITTVATMIALDLGQTAISLRSLHQRSSTILSRLHQVCDITLDSGSLLSVIRLLCHDREKFEQQDRQHVLLCSCLPYTLSQEGQRLLRSLQHVPDNKVRKIPQFSIATLSRGTLVRTRAVKHSNQQWSCLCRRAKSVAPSPALFCIMDNQAPKSSATNLSKSSINPHQKILSETLGVLFTSECLVLTEYLESIIPILYGNFTLLVVNLPSAPYHVNLIGVNRENVEATLFNIYVYALLEFASLVTLALMMMRNCRLQAIYHLAFVLETQAPLVQVKLMTWALMALSFRVVHFGKKKISPMNKSNEMLTLSCAMLSLYTGAT